MTLSIFSKALSLGWGLFFLASTSLHGQSAWELKKDENGVKVYVRSVVNQPMKESRATAQFSSSPEAVLNLILDYAHYGGWVPRVISAREVERSSDTEIISYSLNDSPWPVSDRDLVLRNTIKRGADGSITLTMKAISGKVPTKSGVVRMTFYEGFYQITPKGNGQVEVVYQALLDPAGSIPAWMANMAVVDTPYDLLIGMRKKLTGR
jgi:hypothetical protein